MKNIAIFMMVFCTFTVVNAAKIYKWVDEDGQIHYSSQKPPGQKVESVKVKKGPKVTEPAKQESNEASTNEAQTQDDAESDALAKEQLAKADAVNNKRMCEQARKNIAALNASVRVVRVDDKTGETVRMSDNERLDAMKKAQQAVKEFCK